MSEDDRRRWDEKHAAALARLPAGGADPGNASFLAWAEPELPRAGRALDVACGRGGAAIALARRGLTVYAVDVSLVALGAVRHAADAAGVAGRVRTLVADLDAGLPGELGAFEVVLCVHFHQPALWPGMRAALAPGGVLAMETLTTMNADLGLGGPSRRWLVEPGRLREAAEGLTVVRFEETRVDGLERARLIARRET